MSWKVKYNLFGRHILIHKHENVWIETFKKGTDYFCCKCEEKYEFPHVATLTGVTSRPNNRTYFEIYENFKGKVLRLNIQPSTDTSNWDDYGHKHGKNIWRAVNINGQICCPDCLELAPEGSITTEALPIRDPLRPFMTGIKTEKDSDISEEMVQITYV